MDPLTHGLLGATAAATVLGNRHTRAVLLAGFIGGAMPDIDVLIKSSDPLVGLVYHRHFTHSIFLAPLVGALGVAPLLLLKKFRSIAPTVLAAGIIGCFTHGLLDALTSYGTVLFWPFSNARISMDALPIVDLFFTPVLLAGLVASVIVRRSSPARIAMVIALVYTLAGFVMNGRALTAQAILAESRGHTPEVGRALPAPGTLVMWRSVYRHEGMIYMDDVRTPWVSSTLAREGTSVPHLVADDLPTTVTGTPRAVAGFETFAWFANDFTGWIEGDVPPGLVGDYRYGASSDGIPLWGLQLLPEEEIPYDRWFNRGRGDYSASLWERLTRGDDRMRPVRQWSTP
ncbi:MAG: metal-dependent hydrolase [Candidatus Sumerlaeia bacterium]|nr:metal-dependent hydrolase [Candidatus Sumerlaeia bacterium]